ncbi:tetratricopeptide repeat protein [Streptomyces sp. NPDC020807]|uniref:tetratricopeptide repeat protein n=1 Tax=Streptomyces sp. NPDC020807 TaxID=3155119 RepID=UPI0033D16A5E
METHDGTPAAEAAKRRDLERRVAALRRAAAVQPDPFLGELGYALLELGGLLAGDPDRHDESIGILGEAADAYRDLLALHGDVHLPGLAVALHRQALSLGVVGRREEARAAADAAVAALHRAIGKGVVEDGRGELADALVNLGNQLAETGRHHEALDRITEAVALRRSLVDPATGAGSGALASSLGDLGIKLGEMGRQPEAVDVLRQAIGTYRDAAERAPGARTTGDTAEHAAVAFALARTLTGLGRTQEAGPYFAEATALRAEVEAREPRATAFVDRLLNLYGYGRGRGGAGGGDMPGARDESGAGTRTEPRDESVPEPPGEARTEPSVEPSTDTRTEPSTEPRSAAPADPLPDIDRLNSRALALAEVGRIDLAVATLDQAVALGRAAAAADGGGARAAVALARTLHNLGLVRAWAGRRAQALEAVDEAVHLGRRLLVVAPDVVRPLLAEAADSLGSRLAVLGRHRDAVAPATESVALYRQLAHTDPLGYEGELARALNNLGIRLTDSDRHAESLAVTEQAVDIHRRLHRREPEKQRDGLVHALSNLALRLARIERADEVAQPTAEAVRLLGPVERMHPSNDTAALAESLAWLAWYLRKRGHRDTARDAARTAEELRRLTAKPGR